MCVFFREHPPPVPCDFPHWVSAQKKKLGLCESFSNPIILPCPIFVEIQFRLKKTKSLSEARLEHLRFGQEDQLTSLAAQFLGGVFNWEGSPNVLGAGLRPLEVALHEHRTPAGRVTSAQAKSCGPRKSWAIKSGILQISLA